MFAMFDNVREFAKFNAKSHLFTYGEPTQMTEGSEYPVYVELKTGDKQVFSDRVNRLGGTVLVGAYESLD